MRFVYQHSPDPKTESAPGGSAEKLKKKADLQQNSNTVSFQEFIENISAVDAETRQKCQQASTAWETDPDETKAVTAMRKGEIDPQQNLDQHSVLFTTYLEKTTNEPDTFRVNFEGKDRANNHLGLGELLPRSADEIEVITPDGQKIRAIRGYSREVGQRRGDDDFGEAYYMAEDIDNHVTSPRYIPVFNNHVIKITKKIFGPEAQKKWKIIENQKKDELAMENSEERKRVIAKSGIARQRMALGINIERSQEAQSGDQVAGWSGRLDQKTAASGKESVTEKAETAEIPRSERLARIAESTAQQAKISSYYDPVFRENPALRGKLNGGIVGCAFVTTDLLKQAGYFPQNINIAPLLAVDGVKPELLKRGWKEFRSGERTPQRGDVIIWEPVPEYKNHKHIGVAIGPNRAIDNHSRRPGFNEPGPMEDSIFNRKRPNGTYRKVETILVPPPESVKTSPKTSDNFNPAEFPKIAPYDNLIEAAIKKAQAIYSNIPKKLVYALIEAESGGNPRAVSPAGAVGLTQLMPRTAQSLGLHPSEFFDPRRNIEIGVQVLAQNLKTFNGNIPLALAAYNAGPGNVKKYNGIPPFKETRTYVAKITKRIGIAGTEIIENNTKSGTPDTGNTTTRETIEATAGWQGKVERVSLLGEYPNGLNIPKWAEGRRGIQNGLRLDQARTIAGGILAKMPPAPGKAKQGPGIGTRASYWLHYGLEMGQTTSPETIGADQIVFRKEPHIHSDPRTGKLIKFGLHGGITAYKVD